jgi:hypothetical protein
MVDPPSIATETLNDPSAAAVVDAIVVADPWSVFVAATYTVLPAAVFPVTTTGDPATPELSAGLVTVSVVAPCLCAT